MLKIDIEKFKYRILFLLLFTLLSTLLFPGNVIASEDMVTIGMPFEGKWASKNDKVLPPYHDDDNDSHPSLHDAYGAHWGTDVYGVDKEVRINIDDPNNIYKLRIIQVTNNNCNSGKRVRVGIKNADDKEIGWVQYEHLDTSITATTPIKNHDVLGRTKNWGYSECYQVRTNEGVHTHIVMKNTIQNYSCYIEHTYAGIVLKESDGVGIIGSSNTGPKQACPAQNPSATPYPTKTSTKENVTANNQIQNTKRGILSRAMSFITGMFSFLSPKHEISPEKKTVAQTTVKATSTPVVEKRVKAVTCTGQSYSFTPPAGYSVKEVTTDKFANFIKEGEKPCPYYELIKENNDGYHTITINRQTHKGNPYPQSIKSEEINVAGMKGFLFVYPYNQEYTSSELQKVNTTVKNPTQFQRTPEYDTWSEGQKKIWDINMARGVMKGMDASVYLTNESQERIELPIFDFRTSSTDKKYFEDFKKVLSSVEITIR